MGQRTRASPVERFWPKVDKDSHPGGCWVWTAAITSHGYGNFWSGERFVKAHRFSYQLSVGSLAPDDVLDHLCRNRACVNPTHLDVVTHKVNNLRGLSPAADNARKMRCPAGHAYDYVRRTPHGEGRDCKTCKRDALRRFRERRRRPVD